MKCFSHWLLPCVYLKSISFISVNITGAIFVLCLVFKVWCRQCTEAEKACYMLWIASGKKLSHFGNANQRTSYFQLSTLFVQLQRVACLSETATQSHFSYLLLKKYSQRKKLSCGLVAAQEADIFLFDTCICPSSGPMKHAGTENHLRSLEELIPFEWGLRIMQMSRGICYALNRRNKPINWWNVEHLRELQGLWKAKKPSRVGPQVDSSQLLVLSLVRTRANLMALTGSGLPSPNLRSWCSF